MTQQARKCGICEFASADMAAFTEHMRSVHDWGRRESPKGGRHLRTGEGIVAVCAAVVAAAASYPGLGMFVQNCKSTSEDYAAPYCDVFWLGLPFVAVAAAMLGFSVLIFVLRRVR